MGDNQVKFQNKQGQVKPQDNNKKEQHIVDPNLFQKKEKQITPSNTQEEIISEMHNVAMVEQVKNNDQVKEKILNQANESINAGIEDIKNKNTKKLQDSTYNANKDACQNYGVVESAPIWQIKLMKIGSGFWFIIYFIFATFTFCPINVFAKGIKSIFKNVVISVIFAILCYLIIMVGLPLLISFLRNKGLTAH